MDETPASFAHEIKAAVAAFAPLGWALYGDWHWEETRRLHRWRSQGASVAQIDEGLTELWNTRQSGLLRHVAVPLGRYGRGIDLEFQRRCQQRASLISEAVRCHEDGKYAAAVPLLLAQIDGITREVMGSTFFQHVVGEGEPRYTDDHTLAGVEGNLPLVRVAFSQPVDRVGRYGLVSRHGILHGQDLSYATRTNSTKTLVLLGALIEHLESAANARAGKWRRRRDLDKSKLSGVDGDGRLRDDRGLEETYLFRAEFETDLFNGMLQEFVPRAVALERAHVLLAQQRLSRAAFTLDDLADDRAMWHVRTPGGHHLGSAIRVVLRPGNLPNVEHWTWDAPDAPEHAPWQRGDGWTPTQDEPTTANWRFSGFFTG